MKSLLILFINLAFHLALLGQNNERKLDSLVSDFTASLKKAGISQIGYAKRYCVGSWIRTKDVKQKDYCPFDVTYFRLYLFWKADGKTFLKKFDNCGAFNQIEIASDCFIPTYIKHKEQIKREFVKPMQTIATDTLTQIISVDHSCRREIVFFDANDTITKYIDDFDLGETESFDRKPNLNYEENSKLKIVEWDKITGNFIAELEKKKKFKRIENR